MVSNEDRYEVNVALSISTDVNKMDVVELKTFPQKTTIEAPRHRHGTRMRDFDFVVYYRYAYAHHVANVGPFAR